MLSKTLSYEPADHPIKTRRSNIRAKRCSHGLHQIPTLLPGLEVFSLFLCVNGIKKRRESGISLTPAPSSISIPALHPPDNPIPLKGDGPAMFVRPDFLHAAAQAKARLRRNG